MLSTGRVGFKFPSPRLCGASDWLPRRWSPQGKVSVQVKNPKMKQCPKIIGVNLLIYSTISLWCFWFPYNFADTCMYKTRNKTTYKYDTHVGSFMRGHFCFSAKKLEQRKKGSRNCWRKRCTQNIQPHQGTLFFTQSII